MDAIGFGVAATVAPVGSWLVGGKALSYVADRTLKYAASGALAGIILGGFTRVAFGKPARNQYQDDTNSIRAMTALASLAYILSERSFAKSFKGTASMCGFYAGIRAATWIHSNVL